MGYGIQTAVNEQTTLFVTEQTAKPKCSSIPVFKVTLVREGKMPWGETRMRNSQMVSALLHKYLDGVDREHLCVVLLNQKNENKYPPAKPEVLRLLAPQRGLTAIAKSKPKTEKTTNGTGF